MGDVIAFPGQKAEVEPSEPTEPPPVPSDEAIMEFDFHAKRITEWGSIDGEEFWSNIDAIKELIDEWSRG